MTVMVAQKIGQEFGAVVFIFIDVGDVQLVDYLFFFFQAEDGIRDLTVTGVQTCALPISSEHSADLRLRGHGRQRVSDHAAHPRRNAARRLEPRTRRRADGLAIPARDRRDRKSTRLNSSHSQISYAVFCLKKKTTHRITTY